MYRLCSIHISIFDHILKGSLRMKTLCTCDLHCSDHHPGQSKRHLLRELLPLHSHIETFPKVNMDYITIHLGV